MRLMIAGTAGHPRASRSANARCSVEFFNIFSIRTDTRFSTLEGLGWASAFTQNESTLSTAVIRQAFINPQFSQRRALRHIYAALNCFNNPFALRNHGL